LNSTQMPAGRASFYFDRAALPKWLDQWSVPRDGYEDDKECVPAIPIPPLPFERLAQLVYLVLDPDTIAHDRSRKPTLRAEGQTFVGNVLTRFLDACHQLLFGFPARPPRGHQPQYSDFVFGHFSQSFERT